MVLRIIFGLLLSIQVSCGVITQSDSSSLSSFSSNKGESSYYEFRFLVANTITSEAQLSVTFPSNFDYVCFPKEPDCFLSLGSTNDYMKVQCTISRTGVVSAAVTSLSKGTEITFIVGSITNPKNSDSTSQFRIRTYSRDVLIDANDQFGFISFAESPKKMISGNVFKISNDRINEGSSWEFRFTPTTSYSANNSVRITFPIGFSTNQVLCDVDGVAGQQPEAKVLFNQRVITCSNIFATFNGGEQKVKIINMKNPDISGIFVGFSIEILQGLSTVVLEKIDFSGNIYISPGEAKVTYTASDQLRVSNSTYTFFVNLINPVYYGGKLFVNFTQDWTIYNPNCTIISGFDLLKDQPVTCSLVTDKNVYVVEHFQKIDNSKRIVLSFLLQTPSQENEFPITISTYNSERGAIVDLKTVLININSTYGYIKRFVAHPQKLPTAATAGKCGSLEMDFFLKTLLPKSDIDSFGKIRVDIFPQIPIPDSAIYGPAECKFFGDIPSANDCSDTTHSIFTTDSTRLKVYFYTPKNYYFQSSEQPISISTSGKNEQYCSGFVIDPLVQRYLIHIQIWARSATGSSVPNADSLPDTPTTDPDEVYFTDWMPQYRLINGPDDPDLVSTSLPNKPNYQSAPTLTYASKGIQASSFTFLEFTYTHKDTVVKDYTLRSSATRNYILRVNFNSGWQTTLGQTKPTGTDEFIKNYPCLLKGSLIDPTDSTKEYSRCDLYLGSPYPYLQVNNIPTLLFDVGNFLYIGIPKIQISSSVGASAVVWVEVLEETPGFWDPIVFVYKSTNITLFTVASANGLGTVAMTYSASLTLNDNPTYSFSFSQSTTSVSAAAISWDPYLPISFEQVSCTGTSGTLTCVKFGAPVYQIYVTGAGLQTANVNILMPSNTSVNLSYEITLNFSIQVWATSNQLISKLVSASPIYPPATMSPGSYVSSIAQPSYWYQGYRSSHTITFTLMQPVPDNWFLKFIFSGGQTVVDDEYFLLTQTNLVGLDKRGILLTFNGATFIIYNLKGVAASVTITVTLTVAQPSTTSSTASVVITTEHSYPIFSPTRRINLLTQTHADSPFTLTYKAMTDLEMMNPISYRTIDPIVGQIGTFNFNFNPGYYQIDQGRIITLFWEKQNGATPGFAFHYNSVSGSIVTPVCSINSLYHSCSASDADPTYITVTINLLQTLQVSTYYAFEITTDTAGPEEGLIFPTVSKYYQFKMESTFHHGVQKFATYYFVRPVDFSYVKATLAHTTAASPNLMEISFIPSVGVSSFSNGGRIELIFPTLQNSTPKYGINLGLGTKNPGCYFTGAFAKEATASSLLCLINAATATDIDHKVVITIINFQALTVGTTYTVLIGGIINPASTNPEVRITLLTSQIAQATNSITYLNSWIINIDLLNFNVAAATTYTSSSTTFSTYIQDPNIDVVHSIIYSSALSIDDYFVTDLTATPLGEVEISGTEQNIGNIKTCNTSLYQFCVYMKEIQWIVWKLKTALAASISQAANISILCTPLSIQRSQTNYVSHIMSGGKYIKVNEFIPIASWNSLLKTPTSVSMQMVYPSEFYMKNRAKSEILILFSTSRDLYSTGSIEIAFSAAYTPYHHCRSQITLGSQLYSVAGNNFGEVGCKVQGTSWYITGFQYLARNSQVVIQGMVTLPTTAGTFSVYTYGTTDDSSINTNGQTVEFVTGIAGTAIVNVSDFQFNTQMMLSNYVPMRAGHKGEYRVRMKFPSALSTTYYLNFVLSRQKLIASSTSTSDGFQSLNSIKSTVICYAIKVSDNSITPLAQNSYTENSSDISIQFATGTSIAANTDYIFVLTTQQMQSSLSDGIIYPLQPGLYRVYIFHTNPRYIYTDFVEVYGADFSSYSITYTNNQAGKENLICITFKPSTAIVTSDLFFITFETQTLDSIILFPDNLGYTVKTFQPIPGDIIGATSGSATCYMVRGSSTYSIPAKIYCTGFSVTTSTTAQLWVTITNPATVAQDIILPIVIYTLSVSSSGEYTKKNWSIMEQTFQLLSATAATLSAVTPTRSDLNFGTNIGLTITFPTPVAMDIGDMLIVKANFTGIPPIASSAAGTCTNGLLTILGSNKKLLCLFTSAVAASTNIDFITTGVDQFFNPWRYLTTAEMQISGQASYLSDLTKLTQIIPCNVMTQIAPPTLSAGTVTINNPNFVDSSVTSQITNVLFSFTATNLDAVTYIRYTHGISGISLDTSKTECLMASNSDIEISNCYHDGSIYYLTIFPATVSTVKTVSFITRNKPFSTPSSSSAATYAPLVQFYSSTSLFIFQSNVASSSVALFSDPDSTILASSGIGFAADTFVTVQDRYFDFIPFYISNSGVSTGPISFIYSAKETQSAGQTITFQFPSFLKSISTSPVLYSTYVEIYRYLLKCQVNGVDQSSCSFSGGAFSVVLSQTLSLNTKYTFFFNVVDQVNAPALQGFYYQNTATTDQTVASVTISTNTKTIFSDLIYFATNKSLYGNIFVQAGCSIAYAHSIPNTKNLLTITLKLNAASLNLIIFEFQYAASDGTLMYSQTAMFSSMSGSNFPCSGGTSTTTVPRCWVKEGIKDSTNTFSKPIKVFMSDFTYTTNTAFNVYLMIQNPLANYDLNLNVYALDGSNEAQQTMSGYLKFFQVFRASGSTTNQSTTITQNNLPPSSVTYDFPRQGSNFIMFIIPLATCSYTGAFNTQQEKLFYINPSANTAFQILFDTSATSPYVLSTISCSYPSTIYYYEADSPSVVYYSTGTYANTQFIASSTSSIVFSLNTARTAFYSVGSFSNAQGVLTISVSSTLLMSEVMTLKVTISSGISISKCGARHGFLSASGADISTSQVSCTVASASQISLSNFYKIQSGSSYDLEIQLLYTTAGSTGAIPNITVTLTSATGTLATNSFSLGSAIVTSTQSVFGSSYPLSMTTTSNQYSLQLSILAYNSFYFDNSCYQITVEITLMDEFFDTSLFSSATLAGSPVSMISQTSRQFYYSSSSKSGNIFSIIFYVSSYGYWNSGETLQFQLTLNSISNLQVSSPYSYRSQFYYCDISATNGSTTNQSRQPIHIIKSSSSPQLFSSFTPFSISTTASALTEIKLQFTLNRALSSSNGDYLTIQFDSSYAFPYTLISGISNSVLKAEIDCLCFVTSASTVALSTIKCYRHYQIATNSQSMISIHGLTYAAASQLTCFIPHIVNPASTASYYTSFAVYVSLYNGPLMLPNNEYSQGSSTSSGVGNFYSSEGSSYGYSCTSSSYAFSIGSSNVATMSGTFSTSQSVTSSTWAYLITNKQTSAIFPLQTSSCYSTNLNYCRVYSNINNILISMTTSSGSSFSVTLQSISQLSYADSISYYSFQFYIIYSYRTQNPGSSYSWNSIQFPSQSLSTSIVTPFSLYPVAKEFFSPFVISYTLPTIFVSTKTSAIFITPGSYQTSGCSATYQSYVFKCTVSSYVIGVYLNQVIPASATIKIVVSGIMKVYSSDSFTSTYYPSYTSTTVYNQGGSISFSLSGAASSIGDNVQDTIPLLMTQYQPIIPIATIGSFAPLRVQFQHSSASWNTFTSVKLILKGTGRLSDSTATITTKTGECFYKQYNSNGSYSFFSAEYCTIEYDTTNSYNLITAGLPLQGGSTQNTFLANTVYELIVSSNSFSTSPGVSWTPSTGEVVQVKLLVSASSSFYGEAAMAFKDLSSSFTLTKFYYTSTSQTSDTSIYLEITTPAVPSFPSGHLEVLIPYFGSSAFSTKTPTGLTIPCYLSGVSKVATLAQNPRCIVNKRSTSLAIKILSTAAITSGTTVKIAIDDITLPTMAVSPYFALQFNVVGYDSTTYRPYYISQKQISFMFSLTGTVSPSSTTPSVSFYTSYYGYLANYFYFNNNYTTPLALNSGTAKPSKVKIRGTGGWWAMSSNPLDISNFYEYPSQPLVLIWSNPNTNTLYAETQYANGYYGESRPYVYNLINPNLDDKAAYESSPPVLQYKYYYNYYQTLTVTPPLNYLAVTNTYFTPYPTAVVINTEFVYSNTAGTNNVAWMTITLQISDQTNIYNAVRGSFYSTITLTSTSGVDTFYECVFVKTTHLLINTPCDVTAQKIIVIGNVAQETTASYFVVYARAKVTSSTFTFNFSLDQYLYSSSTWSSNTMWSFGYADGASQYTSSYVQPTQAVPSINKYYQNFYNRQLTILKPSFSTIKEANFELTSIAALTAGNTILFEYKTPANIILDPGSLILYCTLLKQVQVNMYSLAKKTTCSYSSGIWTFTIPLGGVAAATTFLLNVRTDISNTGYFQPMYNTFQKQYLYITMSSQVNVIVVEIKDAFYSISFTMYTASAGSWDYLQIALSPKTSLPAGTATDERVIYIDLKSGHYPADGGMPELYAMDGITFLNGQLHDFKGTSSLSTAQNVAQVGLVSLNQSFRYAIVGFSALTASNVYTIKIPMIKNGAALSQQYISVKTVEYSSTTPNYGVVQNEQVYIRNQLFTTLSPYTCFYNTPSSDLRGITYVRTSGTAQIYSRVYHNYYCCWADYTPSIAVGELYILKPYSQKLGYDLQNWGTKTISVFSSIEQFSITKLIVGVMIGQSAQAYYPITGSLFTSADEAIPWGFSLQMRTLSQTTHTYCQSLPTQTFSYFTSAISGTNSVTLIQSAGINRNSTAIVKLVFTVRRLPVGSQIQILCNSQCTFTNHFIHKLSVSSGAAITPNANSVIMYTSTSSDNILVISGYTQISDSTTLNILVAIKLNAGYGGSPTLTYAGVGVKGYYIESFNIGSVPYDGNYYITDLISDFRYQKQLTPGTWNPIQLRYKLISNTVNFAISNNRVEVTIPPAFTRASTTYSFVTYQTTNTFYMIDSVSTSFATTPISVSPPSTYYDMTSGASFSMYFTTRLATNNNFYYPTTYGFQTVSMVEYESVSQGSEFLYDYWIVEPDHDYNLLSIVPFTSATGDRTVLQLQFYLTVAAVSGDEIWVEFQTNNASFNDGNYPYWDRVFSNDLGTGAIKKILDCVEQDDATLISNSKLFCDIIKEGDDTKLPPYDSPTIVRIQITKSIAVGTTVKFLIAGIRNSIHDYRRSVLTVSLRKAVTQTGFTGAKKLSYQTSKGSYTTTPSSFFTTRSTNPTITYNANNLSTPSLTATGVVWDLAQTHTWSVVSSSNFQNNDWVAVYYTLPNNSAMSLTCTPTSSCYIFPTLGLVIAKVIGATGSSASHTITIGNMNNALYRYHGYYYIEHWSANGELRYAYYTYGLIYNWYTTPITFIIKPTLTPQEAAIIDKYWLRDFVNVAKMTITGSWHFNNIKSFWLEKSSQINIFDNVHPYCNATLIVAPAQRKPFPYRFNCVVFSTQRIFLELTTDFPAFSAAIQDTYDIVIYVRMHVTEFQFTNLSLDFVFYSSALTAASDDYNFGVTKITQQIALSPYIQPDMRFVQIASSTFERRKAYPGDPVFLQLLVDPLTPLSSYQINKMIFKIPSQFKYPSVSSLNDCTMVGNIITNLLSCNLSRDKGNTFITIIPDTTYDNTPKVIKLQDTQYSFVVPEWPGGFYNITVQIYSGTLLLETQTVNLTRILGYAYQANTVKVTNILDPSTIGLYYFESQLGSKDVLPGFDTSAASKYTSLEYSFDNSNGYFLQDLGTGLITGQETPCVASSGITTYVKGKITCILTVGTGVEALPTINVYGYDLIPAGTAFKIYFPQLAALGLSIQGNTFSKVRIYYKDINFSDIYYETTTYSTGITTAAAALTPSTVTATATANNNVGQYRDYTFSFALSGTLSTSDFVFFTFPQDYFDKKGDYSATTCTGFTIQIYRYSNQIYLQPSSSQSGTITITITHLINPAFSQNKQVTIIGKQLSGMKIVQIINFQLNQSLNTPILPCTTFSDATAIASTTVSGQNDIVFTVSFITGHILPSNGGFTILLPSSYQFNIKELGVSCTLENFSDSSTCQIGTSSRIDILLKGLEINPKQEYKVQIKHLNSFILPSTQKLTITSYFSENIYLQQKVCEMSFSYPTFLDSGDVYNCYLQIGTSTTTAGYSSLYTFSLQCDNRVRENTLLQINVPQELYQSNTSSNYFTCSSPENIILRSQQCYFDKSGRQYRLNIQLNSIEAMSLFEIQVSLTNPTQTPALGYSFSGSLFSYSIYYATVIQASNNLIITKAAVATNSAKIILNNIPKNSGSDSTYIFSIPPLNTVLETKAVAQIQIKFSSEFSSQIGKSVSCAIYPSKYQNTTLFSTYKSVLSLSSLLGYSPLSCSVVSSNLLIIDTTVNLNQQELVLDNINSLWQHLLISNVINPQSFNSSNSFLIQYSDISNNLLFSYSKSLVYRVSTSPLYLKLVSISSSSSDTRTLSKFSLKVSSATYLPASPSTLVTLTLPYQLYSTVKPLYSSAQLSSCKIYNKDIGFSANLSCYIYFNTNNIQVVTDSISFVKLKSTSSFYLDITSLYTPDTEYTCTSSNSYQYQIKLIDQQSGDITYISAPSVDDTSNCLSFSKVSQEAVVSGPLTVSAGFAYSYTVSLSSYASGLKITPISPSNSIFFSPSSLLFTNFTSKSLTFTANFRSDTPPNDYTIKFEMEQKYLTTSTSDIVLPSQMFLQVIPITITVQKPDESKTPTVTVEDFTSISMGLPILVRVTLSAAPASPIFLATTIPQDYQSILTVQPSILEIPAESISNSFYLTIKVSKVPDTYFYLSFALTSHFPLTHKLSSSVKYLSFQADRTYSSQYNLLSVIMKDAFTNTPTYDRSVPVMFSNTIQNTVIDSLRLESLRPQILSVKLQSTSANSATFVIYSSQAGKMYSGILLYGNAAPTVNSLQTQSAAQIIQYYSDSVSYALNAASGVLDYTLTFQIKGLQAQTNYQLYLYLSSSLGNSDLSSLSFKTTRAPFGYQLSVPLTSVVDSQLVTQALSLTLKVSLSRLTCSTNSTKLAQQTSSLNSTTMVVSQFKYDIFLQPNLIDSSESTQNLVTLLQTDLGTRKFLKSILPAFDIDSTVSTSALIDAVPTINKKPKAVSINYNNATFELSLWQPGKVYAIIRKIYEVDNTRPPVSTQIAAKKDETNKSMSSYQSLEVLTDENGYCSLTFDDLNDGTSYKIFITLASKSSYSPLNLLEDSDIITVEFKTPFNINLGTYEESISYLSKSNPDLAEALKRKNG